MKKILSILIALTLVMGLMSSVAFAGTSSAGSMMIMRKPAAEPEPEEEATPEEATPVEATPVEPEEATPVEATPVEPEEATAEEATPVEPEEATGEEAEEVVEETTPVEATEAEAEEVIEETTPAEAVEEVEEVDPATGEEAEAITPDATASEATESEAEEDELGDLISESDYGAFKVYIYSNRKSVIAHGEIITLTCVTEGFDGYTLSYQWECDDGNGFVAVEGANAFTYSFAATAETLAYDWRVIVTATK